MNYILLIDFYFGIKFHKNIYYLNEFVRSSLDLENDITLRKKDGYISLDELKRWSIINNNSVAFAFCEEKERSILNSRESWRLVLSILFLTISAFFMPDSIVKEAYYKLTVANDLIKGIATLSVFIFLILIARVLLWSYEFIYSEERIYLPEHEVVKKAQQDEDILKQSMYFNRVVKNK